MSRANIEVTFAANTRPARRVIDEACAILEILDEEEADARALGRTLEEIDSIQSVGGEGGGQQ